MAIKGVNPGGAGIGHHGHVRCVDRLPTADGRAVKGQALGEGLFLEQVGADREVLPFAVEIGEFEIDQLDAFILDLPQDVLRGFGHKAGASRARLSRK